MIHLRPARHADARELATLAETTFRTTFAAMNTAEDMDRHCRDAYGEAIQAQEIASPDRATLVVEHGQRLIAYAQMRWGNAPACVTARAPGELQRLYVIRDFHGRGVAHDLMRACLAEMAARTCDVVWLGVWERNPRAMAFYRKFGFREVGEHVFPLGGDPQRDLVMARAVAARPPVAAP